ncbi:MAG: hypothetical protein IJU10_04235 [Clostridia bacterium]|nr:hypothetical protein [Clostridia bacterium]
MNETEGKTILTEKQIIREMLKIGIQLIKRNYDAVNGKGEVDRLIDGSGFLSLYNILSPESAPTLSKVMEDMASATCRRGVSALEIDFILIPVD